MKKVLFYVIYPLSYLRRVITNYVASLLRGKTGWRDYLYRVLTPISHYILEFRVLKNIVFLSSERFLTLISLQLAVLGILNSLINSNIWHDYQYYIAMLTLPTIAFSLLLARINSEEFVKCISSGEIKDSQFIKHSAYEAHRVVEYVYRYVGQQQEIIGSLQRMKDSMRITETNKASLSERLKITPRELSDDFLKFSASIFYNRCTKLADLETSIKNEAYEGHEAKKTLTRNSDAIIKYIKASKDHLYDLINTKVNIDNLVNIFQTRSISGATRQFIKFIELERPNLTSFKDLRLVVDLQKAHRTGSAAHKAIGLAITQYIREVEWLHSVPDKEKNAQVTDLINRISCLSDIWLDKKASDYHLLHTKTESSFKERLNLFKQKQEEKHELQEYLKSFQGWHMGADKFVTQQRVDIRKEFNKKFSHIYKNHNDVKNGEIYIVISSYSRAVRSILRKALMTYKDQKINFVICSEEVNGGNYSSRLMYQQFIEEFNVLEGDKKGGSPYWRTWRSSFQELESRLVDGQDTVVYLAGCDQIDVMPTRNGKNGVVIYKYSPISILEGLCKNKKDIEIITLIVAGEYKYNPHYLCKMITDEEVQKKVIDLLPKTRRSGLYQWANNEQGIKVHLLCSNLHNKNLPEDWRHTD